MSVLQWLRVGWYVVLQSVGLKGLESLRARERRSRAELATSMSALQRVTDGILTAEEEALDRALEMTESRIALEREWLEVERARVVRAIGADSVARVIVRNAGYSADSPPTFRQLRALIEDGDHSSEVIAALMRRCEMATDSTVSGDYAPSIPLRAEDDEGDDLGAAYDDKLGMGEAEEWFRKQGEVRE